MKKLLLPALLLASMSGNAQVKKVVLHDYTGVKCQFCTDGTVKIEALLTANPTTFIPVQIHSGLYTPSNSPLKTPEGDAIDAAVTIPGYPAGTVDMTRYPPANTAPNYTNWTGIGMSRTFWGDAFNVQIAKTAIASVSINNRVKTGADAYEADIEIEFTAAAAGDKDINVNVFILEDSLKAENGLEQTNYNTPNGKGPHNGESPLTWAKHKYVHNNVLRKAISGAWGYTGVVPKAPVVGTKYTKHITFNTNSAWNSKNVRIVAYIAYNGSGEMDKSIINGEMMSLNAFNPASIEQSFNDVQIVSAYPNPSKIGDVVNVEFDLKKNEPVTMNVYNIAGQKVATPYQSNDISGGHFIQWKTGLDNLTPGTYIIELATPTAKHTQRITLQ